MDNEYTLAYEVLYKNHWWWRARESAILGTIEKFHRPENGDKILDVGCGNGLFFDRLSVFGDVQGVEPSESAVGINSPHRSKIFVGEFDDSFQAPHRFGLITLLDVLEHLNDPKAALKKIAGLLRNNGTCIITVPAFRALWTSHDELNHHVTRYTAKSLAADVCGTGLRIVNFKYLFHWLAIAKLCVRIKESLLKSSVSTQSVRMPNSVVNSILKWVSIMELRSGLGLGLPFGSSLFAVLKAL